MDIREVVESTSDAVFAEDLEGTIIAWNEAAERLLGHRRSEAIGRKCWEVLRGRDVYQNRYCGEHCPLRENALDGEPLHTSLMHFRAAGGEQVQVSNCCLLLPIGNRSQSALVHLLSRAEPIEEAAPEPARRPPAAGARAGLSARQLEVLRLLADGSTTEEVAETLGISVATTRNHVQGVLGKLGVHNRMAATVLARRTGLL